MSYQYAWALKGLGSALVAANRPEEGEPYLLLAEQVMKELDASKVTPL
jgi:hypothetical protein